MWAIGLSITHCSCTCLVWVWSPLTQKERVFNKAMVLSNVVGLLLTQWSAGITSWVLSGHWAVVSGHSDSPHHHCKNQKDCTSRMKSPRMTTDHFQHWVIQPMPETVEAFYTGWPGRKQGALVAMRQYFCGPPASKSLFMPGSAGTHL